MLCCLHHLWGHIQWHVFLLLLLILNFRVSCKDFAGCSSSKKWNELGYLIILYGPSKHTFWDTPQMTSNSFPDPLSLWASCLVVWAAEIKPQYNQKQMTITWVCPTARKSKGTRGTNMTTHEVMNDSKRNETTSGTRLHGISAPSGATTGDLTFSQLYTTEECHHNGWKEHATTKF